MGTYYNNNGTLEPIAGRGSGVNRNDVAYVESGTTASRNYSVGQLVYVSGAMYRVKSAIQSGQTFTVGTNIEATTIGGEIQRINNDLSANKVAQYAADLTAYSASNLYTVPYDGYIFMQVKPDAAVNTGVALYMQLANNNVGLIGTVEKTSNVGNLINFIYVKKGMKLYGIKSSDKCSLLYYSIT